MTLNQCSILPDEKPLDRIFPDGGFASVFRTIACIGDSLSSGEFESSDGNGHSGYHDMFEYSWGQYLGRKIGAQVYNFSRGGMTAREYCQSYADSKGFWNVDLAAQCYIIALGVNDIFNAKQQIGTMDDICLDDWRQNKDTFAGWYGRIIQRYKTIQPNAKFFLMTVPRSGFEKHDGIAAEMASLLYQMADAFSYTYVMDLFKYAPKYDPVFHKLYFLGGHMNPMGYKLTGDMVAAYIDYTVRANPEDFAQVPFIGKPWHNMDAKW